MGGGVGGSNLPQKISTVLSEPKLDQTPIKSKTPGSAPTSGVGWGQNMDQGSMDPHFGPGPWTTFMDQVHGPPVMDRVHGQFFLIMRNEQKQK